MRALLLALLALGVTFSDLSAQQSGRTLKKQLAHNKLAKVVLKEVHFDGATLEEALDALGTMVRNNTSEKIQIQWVYSGIDLEDWNPEVKVIGKQMSAASVLKSICQQAGLSVRLDDYAIVVFKKGSQPIPKVANVKTPTKANTTKPKSRASQPSRRKLGSAKGLESSRVEPNSIRGEWDKKPLKGRRPLKKK